MSIFQKTGNPKIHDIIKKHLPLLENAHSLQELFLKGSIMVANKKENNSVGRAIVIQTRGLGLEFHSVRLLWHHNNSKDMIDYLKVCKYVSDCSEAIPIWKIYIYIYIYLFEKKLQHFLTTFPFRLHFFQVTDDWKVLHLFI